MTRRSRTGGDYEVGHGKPPKHTRFPKNESGNPDGTPKGGWPKRQSELDEIEKILRMPVTVRTGDSVEVMALEEASLRKIAAKALGGDLKARQYLDERRARAHALEPPPAVDTIGEDDMAIVKAALARLQESAAAAPALRADEEPSAPASTTGEGEA